MQLIMFVVLLIVSPPVHAEVKASYLDLNLRQNRYMGPVPTPSQESNYSLMAGDLNLETETSGFAYKLNPLAQGDFNNRDEFYFGVPEAYVQPRKIAPWFGLTVGRQKRTWSKADEEFNLGIWQPQLRWDYLSPVQQGLTGVFVDWKLGPGLGFTFFTSPLHFPDQGPQYQLSHGQFESSNRWFDQPHTSVAFSGSAGLPKDNPLYYRIEKPTEEDIVMHSSFGLGTHYEFSPGFWTSLNYAYKPRNQIHLGIDVAHGANIGQPGSALEETAVIHPKIVKHHVATWEMGFDRPDDHGWISLTGDFPNHSGFPNTYYEAALNPMLIAAAQYSHYLFGIFGRPSWLGYSYVRTFELDRRNKNGGLVEIKSSLDRYPYRELAAIDWRLRLSQVKRAEWSLRNRYSYSVPEHGGWLSSAVELVQGPLSWYVGVDILGSEVDPDSDRAGLFTAYRSNDRVFGGVSYVF